MQYDIIEKEDKFRVTKEGLEITGDMDKYFATSTQADLNYIANSGDAVLFIEESNTPVIRLYLREAYSAGYVIKTHTAAEYDGILFHSFTLEKKGN